MARFSRLSRSISIPLAILLAAVPSIAFGSVGFFGPVLPQSGSCHCGDLPLDWGCVVQVIQNLIQLAVSLGVILCVIWIAYAGFSLMVSGGSPEARSQGKNRILNALFGILVILCSWLIVDFVMKILYEPNTALDGGVFGPWNTILQAGENNYCIQPHEPVAISVGSVVGNLIGTATNMTPGTTSDGSNPSANTRGDCTPSGLIANGMSSSIASTMSCITKTEDASCALGAPSGTDKADNGAGPSVSWGIFQINISANNLSQYPACEAAVNNAPLNCKSAFSGGVYTASNHNTHVANQSLFNVCVRAASNAQCNVQAAQDIYMKPKYGGSRNWGTAAQRNCGG